MDDLTLRRQEENTPELPPISQDDIITLIRDLNRNFEGTINRRKRTFPCTLIEKLEERSKDER